MKFATPLLNFSNVKDPISLGFPPSYSNFPMYHRNDTFDSQNNTDLFLHLQAVYIDGFRYVPV